VGIGTVRILNTIYFKDQQQKLNFIIKKVKKQTKYETYEVMKFESFKSLESNISRPFSILD